MFTELHTKFLLSAYPVSMTDQFVQTLEYRILDLTILSKRRYIEGMLILDLSLSKELLKPLQAIITALMVYDMIYLIPKQVRFFICNNDSPYLYSPRFDTFTGMFDPEIFINFFHSHIRIQEKVVKTA